MNSGHKQSLVISKQPEFGFSTVQFHIDNNRAKNAFQMAIDKRMGDGGL